MSMLAHLPYVVLDSMQGKGFAPQEACTAAVLHTDHYNQGRVLLFLLFSTKLMACM